MEKNTKSRSEYVHKQDINNSHCTAQCVPLDKMPHPPTLTSGRDLSSLNDCQHAGHTWTVLAANICQTTHEASWIFCAAFVLEAAPGACVLRSLERFGTSPFWSRGYSILQDMNMQVNAPIVLGSCAPSYLNVIGGTTTPTTTTGAFGRVRVISFSVHCPRNVRRNKKVPCMLIC